MSLMVVSLMHGTTALSSVAIGEPPTDPLWKVVGLDDVNHDGFTDLVWQHDGTRVVLLWLMNGYERQSWTTVASGVTDVNWKVSAVAHVDADEHADLVWQNTTTGAIGLWTLIAGAVANTLPFNAPATTDSNWAIVSVADMDGDGDTDVIWQHTDGRVLVWYMDGATYVGSALLSSATTDSGWRLIAVR